MTESRQYEAGRFCWVDLNAHDMAAAQTWYGDLFGWECTTEDTQGGPPYGMFKLGGKVVAGVGQMSDEMKASGVPPLWNNYVSVEDVAKTAARVVELGGTVMVPSMKIMDAGWLAFFTDPQGGMFAVWQAGEHHGAEARSVSGAMSWHELMTTDLDQSLAFYGELFGWTFSDASSGHVYKLAQQGGRDVCGVVQIEKNWGAMRTAWGTYFSVDDTDASVAKIKATGGKVVVGPQDIAPGRFAVVQDPQGGMFSIIKPADAS